jgi:hypothetical protein
MSEHMEPNPEPIKEILDELFSLLESLEAQSLALTQFLKDQGIATDKKLAPYLDRAGNASSVKWRAARARMQYLLSPVPKQANDPQKDQSKDDNKEPEKASIEKQSTEKQSAEKPPAEQNRTENSEPAQDKPRNKGANADKHPKPAAEDEKKSAIPQKSKRE